MFFITNDFDEITKRFKYIFFQEEEAQVPRKRRPGVSDSIIPTKKAMDFHKRVYNTSN